MNEFIVVYDYGMGGAWGIATAESEHAITELFPELQIVRDRPDWMDDDQMRLIRQESAFVIGDESTYPQWLRVLKAAR